MIPRPWCVDVDLVDCTLRLDLRLSKVLVAGGCETVLGTWYTVLRITLVLRYVV